MRAPLHTHTALRDGKDVTAFLAAKGTASPSAPPLSRVAERDEGGQREHLQAPA